MLRGVAGAGDGGTSVAPNSGAGGAGRGTRGVGGPLSGEGTAGSPPAVAAGIRDGSPRTAVRESGWRGRHRGDGERRRHTDAKGRERGEHGAVAVVVTVNGNGGGGGIGGEVSGFPVGVFVTARVVTVPSGSVEVKFACR